MAKPALWKRLLWSLRFLTRRLFWVRFLSLGFLAAFAGLIFLIYMAHDLPSVDGLYGPEDRQPGITIQSRSGVVLASYGDIYGSNVAYDDLPEQLIQAVLATEDRRFFEHHGIDIRGIARAMIVNLRAGRFVQGGSTVTQQVAKNVFLSPERTLKRKFQEMLLAFWLEARFSKEAILELYLNRVYLGSGNYGVDAASRRFFDKPVTKISLIEAATLAGLLKAPSRYSPLNSEEQAKKRAREVLQNMVEAGWLAQDAVEPAMRQFTPPERYRDGDASGTRYFGDWVMDELPLYLGRIDQDITVVTTLDADMQTAAEDAVRALMDEHGAERKAGQAALLSMSPDGAVRAMVGGRDYNKSQYNRAVQAERQAGSVFKLFVYLAALEAGYTPDSFVTDQPVSLSVNGKTWKPGNFSNSYRGEIPLSEALMHSVNTVAVQLSQQVGVGKVVEMAKRLGVENVPAVPSIALGSYATSLMNMTTAFAHLANQGRSLEPYGIQAIYSARDGAKLFERSGSGLWPVLDDHIRREMTAMLERVPQEGTGKRAAIGRPMAGKTGTSSDYRDAWFIGFVPQLVTGVWVGNDDNSPTNRLTGGNLPAMIWGSYMKKAVAKKPVAALDDDWRGDGVLPEAWLPDGQHPQQPQPSAPSDSREGFWDRLFDEVGGIEPQVEYDYPNQRRR
jgi:penicillin-binding protein 1A